MASECPQVKTIFKKEDKMQENFSNLSLFWSTLHEAIGEAPADKISCSKMGTATSSSLDSRDGLARAGSARHGHSGCSQSSANEGKDH